MLSKKQIIHSIISGVMWGFAFYMVKTQLCNTSYKNENHKKKQLNKHKNDALYGTMIIFIAAVMKDVTINYFEL